MTASSNEKPKAPERVITYDFLNRKPCDVCAHPSPRLVDGEHRHRLCDPVDRAAIEAEHERDRLFLEQGNRKRKK